MDQTELKAIVACQAGRLDQFTALYELYAERIYRFVYYKTWHREVAEDLTSLTFLKALEHITDYDIGRGNFSSWLYRIAHNNVVDYYRTAKLAVDIDDIFNLAAKQDLFTKTEVNLALEEVKKYLGSLSSETRDLLFMRLWQGLSYQEIAEITGKSEGALKMSASRALRQLRDGFSAVVFLLIANLI